MDVIQTPEEKDSALSANRVGFFAAVLTALLAPLTFVYAFAATPITGVFCQQDCVEYPYLVAFRTVPAGLPLDAARDPAGAGLLGADGCHSRLRHPSG